MDSRQAVRRGPASGADDEGGGDSLSRFHQISGCENAARKADVVFLHGLGGDALTTWRYGADESTSWPHWLGAEFSDVGVWSLGYAVSPSKWTRLLNWIPFFRDAGHTMPLPDRAVQVLDAMVKKGLGERPILFVCHSLGGLLAKQILRKSSDATDDARKQQIARQTRAVLFLATPHAGAELATLLDAFRSIFGTTVTIEELREHDAHLRDLYDWYRGQSRRLGIHTATYYEKRSVRGLAKIVNDTSAHPGVGDDPIPLDEDHLSIAKPRERDAQVCDAVRDLLRRFVLAPPAAIPAIESASPALAGSQQLVIRLDPNAHAEPPRIPCELPPAAFHFVGRRDERRTLVERLRAGRSTAVAGAAGLGKTALAAEALIEIVGADGGNLASSPFPDGVVYVDLYTNHGAAEPVWNALANRLRGPEFMDRAPARERAAEACRGRRMLLVVEGGEEADGGSGRTTIAKLFGVLAPENRWLLLTRLTKQALPAETVSLREALEPEDAAALLGWLTRERPLAAPVRESVLALLEGHPLALNWAGGLLAREEEDPAALARDWRASALPPLSDPKQAEHTLQWLFARSVRGLEESTRQALAAAGLLARAPFAVEAIAAGCGGEERPVRDALKALAQRGLLRRMDDDRWQFTHVLGYGFARNEESADGAMRERLGLWLHRQLLRAVQPDGGGIAAVMAGRLLDHAAALLRTDRDQRLWRPLAEDLLYDIGDRLTALGRLDLTRAALDAVSGWMERFPREKAEEAEWRRERSVFLDRHGNVLRAQGDLAGALAAYRESLTIFQRLSAIDPSNTQWQRDLSVGHIKVGDALQAQRDLAGALAAYRESLTLIQRLAGGEPSNAQWQRDLSVGHDRVGDVLLAQGDLAGALAAYRESLTLDRRLSESDPSNTQWQRDLSVSHNKVGDVLRAQGDLEGALAAYRESLRLRQRLSESDLSNMEWRRDLSLSLTRLAEIHEQQNDRLTALPFAEESLAIDERLAALDPTNVMWQKDVRFTRALVARLRGES
ncbi:MAG TPA: tetratricopeptide repeat protein [Thermoanaerobaculia bacterium]|nr:tetratricopeptide repeat protein [Thermoanaerobaculia bacterium]